MVGEFGKDQTPCRVSGDDFQRLWIKNYAFFLKYAISLVRGDAADAEDVLSSATLKVLVYFSKVDGITNFKALMCLAIRQVYFDKTRGHKHIASMDPECAETSALTAVQDPYPSIEERLIARERLKIAVESVHEMPKVYQDVMEMRFFQEMTIAEVAMANGLSEVNTRKKISVMRKRLNEARSQSTTKIFNETPHRTRRHTSRK